MTPHHASPLTAPFLPAVPCNPSRSIERLHLRRALSGLVLLCGSAAHGYAQLSFSSAINLALQNSPRVKLAQDDVEKAVAALAQSRDIYVPSVIANGGAGYSYGITLSVPTVFTVNAQSLVYSPSQRSYVRAARLGLESSLMTLKDVRERVEEDTAITYLALDHAQQAAAALQDEYGFASRLVAILEDRLNSGLESELDVKRARRSALQIKLDQMQQEDEMASLRQHMGELTGLPTDGLMTVREGLPSDDNLASALRPATPMRDNPQLLSAEANAESRRQRAIGDTHHLWRPQIGFAAEYGRVSPINDVSEFYNLHGKYNTYFAGLQVQFPVFDRLQRSRAAESVADASHAIHELEALRAQQSQEQLTLQHSIAELQARAQLAEMDRSIAQDELTGLMTQLQHGGNGRPIMTPKDEQNARIEERRRHLALLDATLQMQKAEISLLRQTGSITAWLQTLIRTPPDRSGP